MRISNSEFYNELKKYHETEVFSKRLGELLEDLIGKVGSRANFVGYSYLEEMKGFARERCINAIVNKMFDVEERKNPLSYFYTAIYNSFLKYIEAEKRQSFVKNHLQTEEEKRIKDISLKQ